MKRFSIISLLLILHLLPIGLQAQHLRRRAFWGFRPAPVSDSLAKAKEIDGGVLLNNLDPKGTLAQLGVLSVVLIGVFVLGSVGVVLFMGRRMGCPNSMTAICRICPS